MNDYIPRFYLEFLQVVFVIYNKIGLTRRIHDVPFVSSKTKNKQIKNSTVIVKIKSTFKRLQCLHDFLKETNFTKTKLHLYLKKQKVNCEI